MEVAMRGIAKLLEEVETMKEEVAGLERTRRNVEKAINNMDEQDMLGESGREEFSFEEEELDLEGEGATEVKEDSIIEEEELLPKEQIKEKVKR